MIGIAPRGGGEVEQDDLVLEEFVCVGLVVGKAREGLAWG